MSDIRKPSPEKSDAEFESFLRDADSHLAKLYCKLPHPEPEPSIDVRLRAQARQALRDDGKKNPAVKPASPSRIRAPRWLPAFGAAATLVLAAGVVWRLIPPAAPTHEAVQTSNGAAPVTVSGRQAETVPAPPPAAASKPAPPQTTADSAADAAQLRRKLHRAGEPEQESRAASNAPKSPPVSPNGAAPSAPPTPPASAPPVEHREATAFPPLAERVRMKNAPQAEAAPQPPPPAAAPAPPPPSAPAAATAAKQAAPADAPSVMNDAITSAAAPRQAARENSTETVRTFSEGSVAQEPLSTIRPEPSNPERYRWEVGDGAADGSARSGIYPPDPPPLQTWVEIVRTMLRDGHRDAAKRALGDLRRRHPDFRVPADLRGLE